MDMKQRKANYICDYCKYGMYLSPNDSKKSKSKIHTCSRECKTKIALICPSKTYLQFLHWGCDLPLKHISNIIGAKRCTITRYMKKSGIPTRTVSEDNKRRYKYMSDCELKKQTEGANTKMRKSVELKTWHLVGDKHHNYNPDLTDEERKGFRCISGYQKWRKAVFTRDNYTCICCGDNTGGNLIAHHKEGYACAPELRTTLENGITLCETCHKDFHHNFGYGNNTKKQLYYFLLEHQGD